LRIGRNKRNMVFKKEQEEVDDRKEYRTRNHVGTK
jgi:hypothetical protein